MNCKPPCLAFIVREDAGMHENIGAIVRVIDADCCEPGEWRCKCDHKALLSIDEEHREIKRLAISQEFWIHDDYLKQIEGRPGNEWFFKAAPLDAKQPDRGVTIDIRGEIA